MLKSFEAGSRRGIYAPQRVQSGLRTGLLALAVASASLLHSSVAAALGLGDITLHSALGQPFNADIELIESGGLTVDEIVVGLASADAFAKAGVDRVFFLNDLRFTPVIRGSRSVIHVESHKAVTEPYLNFVVRLVRPNGDQLHEYTVLLDPPTSASGLAATRSRTQSPATGASSDSSRLPVAPPQARQGKHYTVIAGDTLAGVARKVQAPGSKVSSGELTRGIQALNPQAFPNGERSQLKVGQSLLLPDSAVETKTADATSDAASQPGAAPSGSAPAPASKSGAAEQLTATAAQNQQLTKAVDDLKQQVQEASVEEDDKDKQIIELQTQLAELKALASKPAPAPVAPAPAAQPAPTPAPVVKAPAPVPVAPAPVQPVADDGLPWTTLLAVLLVVVLLLALAWSIRRNKIKNQLALQPEPEEPIIKPAQATVTPVFEVPAVTAARPAAPATGGQRLAGAATDALDGASIYIAYGRFAEALAILRDALDKQPERTDVRLRVLELLGEQGDVEGFDHEEKILLGQGMEAQKLEEIRARYPKLSVQSAPLPSTPEPAPVASPAVAPVAAAAVAASAAVVAASEPAPAQLDETAAAALNPEPADDFQLNLDDLSMDADWDLVDPFENTAALRKPAPDAEPELDPSFSSNLTQLPEVFEMPEEQFLSDFAEEDAVPDVDLHFEPQSEPESVAQSNSDLMDDAFLDSFMDEEGGFDLLDLDEAPLSKINEAQVLIDEGNVDEARRLLQEVIDESDDGPQQTARDLLAGLG
jgi:FimV-like protein